MVALSILAALALTTSATPALAACDPSVVSCSPAALKADACCVPKQGLWLFKLRFEPDVGDHGTWSIGNVDVLECDGTQPKQPTNPKLSHEAIGSKCALSGFDANHAERAWAQSEVGEGVEEVWERVWNTDGRFVSSICDGNPARFFEAIDNLYDSLSTAHWLGARDIVPSIDTRYSRADIVSALSVAGHQPVLFCDDDRLTTVVYPVHVVGNLASFVPAQWSKDKGNCPAEGIIYPPAAVLPTSTSTWDPVYRPTMRPITLSHDESRQVKYDDDQPKKETKKKLGFFKNKDQRRMKGEHGHDAYARDEL